MIFVNAISELQQNNLCYREKTYFQPIVIESDVSLQGFLPKQIQNSYSLEVSLMSSDGDEFLADVTADFDALFGVSIYNQNYFNLKLRSFSPNFENVNCFLLRVVVKNNGFTIFDKITEPFQKLKHTKTCYAVIDDFAMMVVNKSGYIKINSQSFAFGQGMQDAGFRVDYSDGNYYIYVDCADVVEIGYCYQNQDVIINVPLTSTEFIDQNCCEMPLMRVESSYNCKDNILGGYYGDPKILLNYPGNVPILKHTNSTYVRSEIEQQPTEIKRESTKNGKPQKVEFIQKFDFIGLEFLPKWKMLEVEALFSGRRIFINGVEFIFRGGKIFTKNEQKGTCSFKLRAEIENAPRYNDFNCLDDCTTNCTYFVIPSGEKDQNYYNENKQLIGSLYQDLLDYFLALPDVITITDIDVSTLDCDLLAVIKIDSFGLVPTYFYYKLPLNEYRIFAKYDDCELPTKLCDGIAYCEKPRTVTSTVSQYNPCPESPVGITSVVTDLSDFEELAPIEYYNGFTADSISIKKYANAISFNFVLSHPTLTDADDINGLDVMKIPFNPLASLVADYQDAGFTIEPDGVISAYGNTTANKLTLIKTIAL